MSKMSPTKEQTSSALEIFIFFLGCVSYGIAAIFIDLWFSINLIDVSDWEGCNDGTAGGCGLAILLILGGGAIIWTVKWFFVEIIFFALWAIGHKLKVPIRIFSLLMVIYFLLATAIMQTITPGLYGSINNSIMVGFMLGVFHLAWIFLSRFSGTLDKLV